MHKSFKTYPLYRAANLPNLSTLKQVRQAFRIRRKGSTSSVEDDERHLFSSKSAGPTSGTSSVGGESSGCEDELAPDVVEGRMTNGYGRSHGHTSIEIEGEDGVLIPHLKSPTDAQSLKGQKAASSGENGKNKDKNQRKR